MTERRRSVCITGTFDVKNYGDLLFPLIAAWRLGQQQIEIVPASPTSNSTGYPDAMDPIGIKDLMCGDGDLDAILIGGGEIVHSFRIYIAVDGYRDDNITAWAHPALWLGATLAAALRDVPVLWNAPGVPVPFSKSRRETVVAATLRAANYVSVRDRASANCLGAPDDVDARVAPDSAVDIARMWPRSDLRQAFQALVARKKMVPGASHMAIHLRARSLGTISPAGIAAMIDDFAVAHGLIPMLVAIGPGVGDSEVAGAVARHLRGTHVVLDDPISLREIAAAIAHAGLYVGASLHGAITSAAYDVPTVIVAKPPLHKIGGFLDHIGRRDVLAGDWPDGLDTANTLLAERPTRWIPGAVLQDADRHWTRVLEGIDAPDLKRGARAAFLRDFTRLGIEKAGPAWSLGPFLGKVASARRTGAKRIGAD